MNDHGGKLGAVRPTTDELLGAAIDVGTNTVLLLVAARTNTGALRVIEERCASPRLGAGLARSGQLDAQSSQRTLDALVEFVQVARAHGVATARVRAVGTAVLRRASDAALFVERVRSVCGLSIEILGEEEEARLSYQAVVDAGGSTQTIVIDVGGGSTELVEDGGCARHSAPIGALVLSETYLLEPPLRAGGFAALRDAVSAACERFPADIALSHDARSIVALGGTAVNLACLVRGLERFDVARVEGTCCTTAAARSWADELVRMPPGARALLPIESERAAILPAGLACLCGALERIGAREFRMTTFGLRHAVLRELLSDRAPG